MILQQYSAMESGHKWCQQIVLEETVQWIKFTIKLKVHTTKQFVIIWDLKSLMLKSEVIGNPDVGKDLWMDHAFDFF